MVFFCFVSSLSLSFENYVFCKHFLFQAIAGCDTCCRRAPASWHAVCVYTFKKHLHLFQTKHRVISNFTAYMLFASLAYLPNNNFLTARFSLIAYCFCLFVWQAYTTTCNCIEVVCWERYACLFVTHTYTRTHTLAREAMCGLIPHTWHPRKCTCHAHAHAHVHAHAHAHNDMHMRTHKISLVPMTEAHYGQIAWVIIIVLT